ncbi:MAG: EamA family transporter [Chloroflexota bacterium]|nr:EamA family transporter [Chloroflexota bacterium]
MAASPGHARSTPPGWLVWAALLVVYIVWGSTYLAIAVVVDSMPPLFAAGARFLVAGLIMAGVLALRSGPGRLRINRSQLGGVAFVGAALLMLGNGGVSMGEQTVPSGLAALIIGVVPLVVLVLRRLAGEKLSLAGVGGVVLGFLGLGVLVIPRGIDGTTDVVGMALLILASTSWATGSFFSRRLSLPRDPLVSTAYQLLLGGSFLLAAGLAIGEWPQVMAGGFTDASIWALIYLIFFGSLLAYTAYTWLLQNAPISQVATYAYVNPVVALALGYFVLNERLDLAMIAGAVMIVTSVAFIARTESRPAVRDVTLDSAPVRASRRSTRLLGGRALGRSLRRRE